MLTEKMIEKSLRFKEQFGSNNGACFGTSDPSRLRPVTPLRWAFSQSSCEYSLSFLSPKRAEISFAAKNHRAAFKEMRRLLKITGRLTVKKFRKAGAKMFFEGIIRVFPRPKKKPHVEVNPYRAVRQFERMLGTITSAPFPRD